MQETQEMGVWSLDGEDPLEEAMATHSSILAWKIPWAVEAGSVYSMGPQGVRHNWAHTHTRARTHTHTQRDLQIKKSGEFSSDLLSFTLLIQRPQVNFEKGSLWNRKSLESKGGMNCFKGYEASQERLEMIIQLGKQYTVVPYPPQFLRASGAPGSLRPFATAYICGYVITTPRWQVAKF